MPWFKVDDGLHAHPKSRAAGPAALGLWVITGSYSMAYKLDGFAPEWFVETWPRGKKLAEQLVKSGLWEAAEMNGTPGWRFHDWLDYQPSAEDIEADRAASRER